MDYLEPRIRLIRAHPQISELSLYGHGACGAPFGKLCLVTLPFTHQRTAGRGCYSRGCHWAGDASADHSAFSCGPFLTRRTSDAMLADVLRHMLLGSDAFRVTFFIQIFRRTAPQFDIVAVDYDAGDYPDYVS